MKILIYIITLTSLFFSISSCDKTYHGGVGIKIVNETEENLNEFEFKIYNNNEFETLSFGDIPKNSSSKYEFVDSINIHHYGGESTIIYFGNDFKANINNKEFKANPVLLCGTGLFFETTYKDYISIIINNLDTDTKSFRVTQIREK